MTANAAFRRRSMGRRGDPVSASRCAVPGAMECLVCVGRVAADLTALETPAAPQRIRVRI